MQNDEKEEIRTEDGGQPSDELEQAYKQTISSSSNSSSSIGSLSDEKQKINNLLVEINKILDSKKGVVEKKLIDLKNLKTEIETGLDELKKIEAKKTTLDGELVKIENLEKAEKAIESEVANISNQI